jgi:hypothetical protein
MHVLGFTVWRPAARIGWTTAMGVVGKIFLLVPPRVAVGKGADGRRLIIASEPQNAVAKPGVSVDVLIGSATGQWQYLCHTWALDGVGAGSLSCGISNKPNSQDDAD